MIVWQDFNVVVLVLVVMQISIVIVVLQHTGVLGSETDAMARRPPLENTVAHLPKPPSSPSIFTPSAPLY